MITIVLGLVGFCILVFFHELGHFVFARISGMKVEEFAVGMGPSVFSFKKNNTQYSFRIFPIGGYCKISGQDDFSTHIDNYPGSFFSKPPILRLLTVLGGPLFSYLLGIIFLSTFLIFKGETKLQYTKIVPFGDAAKSFQQGDEILEIDQQPVKYFEEIQQKLMLGQNHVFKVKIKRNNQEQIINYPGEITPSFKLFMKTSIMINSIKKDSPASQVNLQPMDIILSINNIPVHYDFEVVKILQAQSSESVKIKVKRLNIQKEKLQEYKIDDIDTIPSETYIFSLLPKVDELGKKYIGITMAQIPDPMVKNFIVDIKYSLFDAFSMGVKEANDTIYSSFKGLMGLFSPKSSKMVQNQITGPIGIFSLLGDSYQLGLFYFIRFIGLLSVAIAFFNILPLPALDGGHILFNLIEMITRKSLPIKFIGRAQLVGILLLLSIFIWSIFKDIGRLTN